MPPTDGNSFPLRGKPSEPAIGACADASCPGTASDFSHTILGSPEEVCRQVQGNTAAGVGSATARRETIHAGSRRGSVSQIDPQDASKSKPRRDRIHSD